MDGKPSQTATFEVTESACQERRKGHGQPPFRIIMQGDFMLGLPARERKTAQISLPMPVFFKKG
jgi:hypothetical protein